jgi:hypothetical protein
MSLAARRAGHRFAALPLLIAVGLCGPAQAQSSYTVTKLNGWFTLPGLTVPGGTLVTLDSSNRVHANRSQFNLGGAFVGGLLGAGNTYSYVGRPATWAASTASAVSPVNIAGTVARMSLVRTSDKGSWELIFDQSVASATPVYRVVNAGKTTAIAATPGEEQVWSAINDNGVVAGSLPLGNSGSRQPVTWRAGVLTRLPLGGFSSGGVAAVTPDNVVWGTVSSPNLGARVARWTNGQLTTLAIPDFGGRAFTGLERVNAAGHMVLDFSLPPDSFQLPIFALWRDGVLTALPTTWLQVIDFNNQDIVLGKALQGPYQIWKDGQATDVDTWIRSKGGQLPADAGVEVFDINDQGSILARYALPGSGSTWFRATAR